MPLPPPPEEGTKLQGLEVVKAYHLPRGHKGLLVISRGSVVNFEGDAIVNAANTGCLGGGGVDGAITSAGGPGMARERKALPLIAIKGKSKSLHRCATGDAKITTGGGLKAKRCIHAVGPNYLMYQGLGKSFEGADKLLASAYGRSVAVAREDRYGGGIKTLAFSLLSSGIFRGPRSLDEVLEIGLHAAIAEATKLQSSVGERTDFTYPHLQELHFVAFTAVEAVALVAAADSALAEHGDCRVAGLCSGDGSDSGGDGNGCVAGLCSGDGSGSGGSGISSGSGGVVVGGISGSVVGRVVGDKRADAGLLYVPAAFCGRGDASGSVEEKAVKVDPAVKEIEKEGGAEDVLYVKNTACAAAVDGGMAVDKIQKEAEA